MSTRRQRANASKTVEPEPPAKRRRETAKSQQQQYRNIRIDEDGVITQEIKTEPTASELEEAALLISAGSASSGHQMEEEPIVLQVVQEDQEMQDSDQQIISEVVEDEEEQRPQLTEEELRVELQALLDSQLEPPSNEPEVDGKQSVGKRSDEYITNDAQEPNKGFTTNEITAFMNNQIRKQHQQHVLQEDIEATKQREEQEQQPQQHLILVTQNGDKIILIQNPNEMESDENEQINDYQPVTEIDEQEERLIQAQTRNRQQGLLSQLSILRRKHKATLDPTVLTPSVPHMQPITLVPIPGRPNNAMADDMLTEPALVVNRNSHLVYDDEPYMNDSAWTAPNKRSYKSRPNRKNQPVSKVGVITKGSFEPAMPPKWLKPIISHLNTAQAYLKRREAKIDEVAKFFPSPSQSFEKRRCNLKQDFVKLDQTVERFKNTIGQDAKEATQKFKTFMKDYHLESFVGEIEAEDENDELEQAADEVEEKVNPQKKLTKKQQNSTGSSFQFSIPPKHTTIHASEIGHHLIDMVEMGVPENVSVDPQTLLEVSKKCSISIDLPEKVVQVSKSNDTASQKPVRSLKLQHQLHEQQKAEQGLALVPVDNVQIDQSESEEHIVSSQPTKRGRGRPRIHPPTAKDSTPVRSARLQQKKSSPKKEEAEDKRSSPTKKLVGRPRKNAKT